MPKYSSVDLLERCRRNTLRPSTDAQQLDADWYAFLTEAQDEWYAHLASICPDVLVGPPTVLTTADGGLTYTFGTDADGHNIFPIGHMEIRSHPGGAVLLPTNDWGPAGDFIPCGDYIKWPNGIKRTYGTTGPVARFITPPGVIDDTHEPTLKPIFARGLLVPRACAKWARRGGLRDPQPFLDAEQELWLGNPAAGTMGVLGALRTQTNFIGLQALAGGDENAWWRNMQGSVGYNL
jgi:hypothetical protein